MSLPVHLSFSLGLYCDYFVVFVSVELSTSNDWFIPNGILTDSWVSFDDFCGVHQVDQSTTASDHEYDVAIYTRGGVLEILKSETGVRFLANQISKFL